MIGRLCSLPGCLCGTTRTLADGWVGGTLVSGDVLMFGAALQVLDCRSDVLDGWGENDLSVSSSIVLSLRSQIANNLRSPCPTRFSHSLAPVSRHRWRRIARPADCTTAGLEGRRHNCHDAFAALPMDPNISRTTAVWHLQRGQERFSLWNLGGINRLHDTSHHDHSQGKSLASNAPSSLAMR